MFAYPCRVGYVHLRYLFSRFRISHVAKTWDAIFQVQNFEEAIQTNVTYYGSVQYYLILSYCTPGSVLDLDIIILSFCWYFPRVLFTLVPTYSLFPNKCSSLLTRLTAVFDSDQGFKIWSGIQF